jgi:subtilase family serine protease
VGRHDLKAAIDSENIIKEKDDTNNTCELTFSVHPKTPEYEDRAPDGRVRRLSYQKDLEAITGEPVYIEEVLIEPVSEEGTSTESRITYVVHNISGRDYRNIQITASLPGKFIHSFFIDRLQPDERYKMSFIEKIRDGKINFNIALEESEFEQQGFFVPEEEKK